MPREFVDPYIEPSTGILRNLVNAATYDLDWRQVSGSEHDEASRAAAEDRDFTGLVDIFSRIAMPCDATMPIVLDAANVSRLP